MTENTIDIDFSGFHPTGDRLFVEPILDDREMTEGGIYIPEIAKQEKSQLGRVVAIGDGPWHDSIPGVAPPANVNDQVLFGKYSGSELEVQGKTLLVLRGSDIMAAKDGEG